MQLYTAVKTHKARLASGKTLFRIRRGTGGELSQVIQPLGERGNVGEGRVIGKSVPALFPLRESGGRVVVGGGELSQVIQPLGERGNVGEGRVIGKSVPDLFQIRESERKVLVAREAGLENIAHDQ